MMKVLKFEKVDLQENRCVKAITVCGHLLTYMRNIFQEYDGADDLLLAERHRLRNLKHQLEVQLKVVQQHIMVFAYCEDLIAMYY